MLNSKHVNEQLHRFARWSIRTRLRDKMVIALIMASVASGLATYAAMTRSPFFGSDPTTVMILSLLDLGFLVLLGTVVTHRVYNVWKRSHRNLAGSKLQVKMISVFTLLAVAPAMLVVMFAATFFYCPMSGALLSLDFHRKDEAPRDDILLDLEALVTQKRAA